MHSVEIPIDTLLDPMPSFSPSRPAPPSVQPVQESREHPRTQEDAGAFVQIDPNPEAAEFVGSISGLAIDGSFGGCAVIVVTPHTLVPSQLCWIQLAQVGPLQARVAWIQTLEPSIHKIGLQYLRPALV